MPGDDALCLLPRDPDASALGRYARRWWPRVERNVAVIITDSFGRPWRNGIVNVAIGVAGVAPLIGLSRPAGRLWPDDEVSVIAIADEIASAAELVMGKVSRCPVALVRGYAYERGTGAASEIVMDRSMDLFP